MTARVAASEARLLTVARALVGYAAPETVIPILRRAHAGRPITSPAGGAGAGAAASSGDAGATAPRLPETIGPTARRLLEQTLVRGVVLELARRGGWRPARHLVDGKPSLVGRLWERHAPPELRFSARSMALLRWLLGGQTEILAGDDAPLPLGDELLLYLATELLDRTASRAAVERQPAFARSPLIWLGHLPLLVAGVEARAGAGGGARANRRHPLPDFAPWFVGPRAVVLEALQPELARRWALAEQRKGDIALPGAMIALGAAQEAVLGAFLDAADAAGRRDLAGFLVRAAQSLLSTPRPARSWVASLAAVGTLRERSAAYSAAGAFLRALRRLARWLEEARSTRFFDEGYGAAQLLLAEWEFLGERGQAAADARLRQFEALDAALAPGDDGGAPIPPGANP